MVDIVFNPNIVKFWRQGRHRQMKYDCQKFNLKLSQYQSVEKGYNSINIDQFNSLIELTDQDRVDAYLIRKKRLFWKNSKIKPIRSTVKQAIQFLKTKKLERPNSIQFESDTNLNFDSIPKIVSNLRQQIGLSASDQAAAGNPSKFYDLVVNKLNEAGIKVIEKDLNNTDYEALILPGKNPVIGLNQAVNDVDKISNLSECLAYVVISSQPETVKVGQFADLEKLVDQFSLEFILPTDDLVDYYQAVDDKKLSFGDIVRISQRFAVEPHFINQRLRFKKLISKPMFDKFNRKLKDSLSQKKFKIEA